MICGQPGQCIDVIIGIEDVSKENTCIKLCHDTEDCQYWTFHDVDGICSLFANCSKIDSTTCPSCIHGEKYCQLGEKHNGWSLIFTGLTLYRKYLPSKAIFLTGASLTTLASWLVVSPQVTALMVNSPVCLSGPRTPFNIMGAI